MRILAIALLLALGACAPHFDNSKLARESKMRFELMQSAESNKRSSKADLRDRVTGEVLIKGMRIRNNEASAFLQGANLAYHYLAQQAEKDQAKTLAELHTEIEADIAAAKAASQGPQS